MDYNSNFEKHKSNIIYYLHKEKKGTVSEIIGFLKKTLDYEIDIMQDALTKLVSWGLVEFLLGADGSLHFQLVFEPKKPLFIINQELQKELAAYKDQIYSINVEDINTVLEEEYPEIELTQAEIDHIQNNIGDLIGWHELLDNMITEIIDQRKQ